MLAAIRRGIAACRDIQAIVRRSSTSETPATDHAAFSTAKRSTQLLTFPSSTTLVTILDGYTDCLRFDLRMPSEGGFDFTFYVRGIDPGLDSDLVCHASYPG